MNLPDGLTTDQLRSVIDAIVGTTEAMMMEHGVPRSATFMALCIAAANAAEPFEPEPIRLPKPILRLVPA